MNSNTNKVGLSFSAKVMAGDTMYIFGKSYYQVTGSISGASSSVPMLDLLTAFAGTTAMSGKGITGSDLNAISAIGNGINGLLNTQGAQTSTQPKAYINWIFFDEQFNYAGGGFDRVGSSGVVKSHNNSTLIVPKNGYVFVYCSNESPHNVFFDNLQVIHSRGPILEETHYYPFGLTMAGISTKAMSFGGAENKKKWNVGSELESKEFGDGSGLELYATQFRSVDPQIGRIWQVDPKPDFSQSLYSSMSNNPIRFNDPLGDTPVVPKPPERNPKQDKILTPGEIKKLKEDFGWDHSDKGRGGGKIDLYKDKEGNVYEKAKGNKGPGEPIGINLNDKPENDETANSKQETKVEVRETPNATTKPKLTYKSIMEKKHPYYSQWGYLPGPQTVPPEVKKVVGAAAGAYIAVKIIEAVIVFGSGGVAAPILIF